MGLAAYQFVAGLVTMGYVMAGLFFLRFWKRTGDGLFAAFAAAFWLLAATQALLAAAKVVLEEQSWIYLLRVAAFAIIIAAVIAKNRSSER